jgi:hypothetical protein
MKVNLLNSGTGENIMTDQQPMINADNLVKYLEPLIRRIIREKLTNIVRSASGFYYLNPDMPIYEDMEEIKEKSADGRIKLYSHAEAWNE